jgi:hypothetical protein
LGDDHRNDDEQHDRQKEGIPRYRDRRDAEQQADDRREREHHDRVVERHLRQREVRLAVAQVRPNEDHGRARRRGEDDQAGDVRFDLISRQPRPKQPADEQPAEERHRERLDRPIDEQRHADAAPVLLHLVQCADVDLQQHRDDHQPDQHRHRQVDLGHLHASDRLERGREPVAEGNTGNDAERHPDRQVPLEHAQAGPGVLGVAFGLDRKSHVFGSHPLPVLLMQILSWRPTRQRN